MENSNFIKPQLVCIFTLQNNGLSLGVAFQSDNGGMNYGGSISIQTPADAGPVITGLWDSDGNVFFTIYLASEGVGGANCVINSASSPGSFQPYIAVQSQNGLTCDIVPTGKIGTAYGYTLNISQSNENDFSSTEFNKRLNN